MDANATTADGPPDDLIGLLEAAHMIPSRKPGRTLSPVTMWRWVLAGKLRSWRIGGHYFVSRREVRLLARPVAVVVDAVQEGRRRAAEREAWANSVLREHGIR